MANNKLLRICFFGLWCVNNIFALKITSLNVPKSAWDPVILNCKYDLEDGETLYGVKWYKGQSEFFRCFPNGTNQEFPINDIKVYQIGKSLIGSCFFELSPIGPKSGGEYKCEVSLEWPTFQTVSQIAKLSIIEPSKFIQPEDETTQDNIGLSVKSKGARWLFSTLNIIIFITCIFLTK